MKYPQTQFTNLLAALPVLFKFYGLDIDQVKQLTIGQLHTIHCRVYQQKNYSDDNANVKFVNGKRLFDIDETFLLYPAGCTDNHIETAMKQAIKQLS